MEPKIVYIAGPYSGGDVAVNVKRAMWTGSEIADLGHYPVIPHLTHFMHMMRPRPYEYWLKMDNLIIPRCDALYRMEGKSSGADKEEALAKSLDIPVFHNFGKLLQFLKS